MSLIKPQTLKGFRDFLPEEASRRQYVIDIIRKTFELYGFESLETPALEYEEILLGKYGEEGDKLMYRFEDLGGRKVALRYDQTVPLARVVAQYKNQLPFPFKRYQIQPVWRAENPQKGRFREFLQCDADIVGTTSLLADADVIALVLTTMKKLGFEEYSMRVNDRRIFQDYNLTSKAIIQLDKVDKEGPIVFIKQLISEGKSNTDADCIFNTLVNSKKSKEVNELFSFLTKIGFSEGRNNQFWFDPTLVRGLDYYTSIIFELRIEKYGILSVGGGGRYDNLIGMFTGNKIPAVGFSFGFDRLIEAMDELNLFPRYSKTSLTKVLVTIFNDSLVDNSIKVLNLLREANINSEIYYDLSQKLDKQLKYADKKGIPFAVIIGPEEVKKGTITLKNLQTKTQESLLLNQVKVKLLNKKV